MSRIRLYLDEDAMDGDLARGLRSRGVDVLTAQQASMIRREEEARLDRATARPHAGIIVTQQQRHTVGEQIRRLTRTLNQLDSEAMRNRIEFLGQW